MSVRDSRIAQQARVVAKADAELQEAKRALTEARAKHTAALVRLVHLTEEPSK